MTPDRERLIADLRMLIEAVGHIDRIPEALRILLDTHFELRQLALLLSCANESVAICSANNSLLKSRLGDIEARLAGAEARIDELMFEYCPGEMTAEQIANWAKHQVRATPEQEAHIRAALAQREEKAQ